MRGWRAPAVLALWVTLIALAFSLSLVLKGRAQEHQHPTETITGATAEFYATWFRPDVPTSSCCSEKDCYSTPARTRSGKLQALHRESGDWIDIPPEKVELHRDSPDGLSHLCASSYKFVFCFVAGAGG